MIDLHDALTGITPPLVTPFDEDQIDREAFDAVLDHVIEGGVDAVFPCGTTGEAASLTAAERLDVVRHTVDRVPEDLPVIVGGTSPSIEETTDWIHEVARAGADGVVLTAPYFHGANEPRGYRRYFEAVLAESELPVILYNIPSCVGVSIPVEVVAALADDDGVIGLKDSSGDLGYAMAVQERTPQDFLLLQGFDALLLPSLRMGLDGGINAGANVFPRVYRDVVADPAAPSALERHKAHIRPLFALCEEHGFAPGIKAALVARGIIKGPDVRPPLVSVSEDVVRSDLLTSPHS